MGKPLHWFLLVCSVLGCQAGFAAAPQTASSNSTACSAAGIGAGKHFVSIDSGGRTRKVMIFVPSLAKAGHALPLIFDLHGGGSNGTEQSQFTHFSDLAAKDGFVVANPDGGSTLQYVLQAHNWSIPGAPAGGGVGDSRNAPDDIQFISDAIDQIGASTCIDLRRVYVDGMSAGARMSSFVGCRLSTKVAAIGTVAGLKAGLPSADDASVPDPATCQPQRPMPIIGFHGTGDANNPYYGGGDGGYGIPAALQRWSELDHCEDGAREQRVASNVVLVTYKQCAGGAEIWMYRTEGSVEEGGGHVWPGAPMPNGASKINASELMWQFFKRFSLPADATR